MLNLISFIVSYYRLLISYIKLNNQFLFDETIYAKLKILDSSLKSSITEANGLRNRLVHEYNGISDAIALDSIKDLIDDIYKIIKRVKKWLAK